MFPVGHNYKHDKAMNVDFNNARLQLAFAYDRVCSALNAHIEDGEVRISVDALQKRMDDLRELACLPCHIFEEGNPNFLCLSDKIEGKISWFNPEEEDSQS